MGREIRKVPANWQHPRDPEGRYIPLLGYSYSKVIAEWDEAAEKWAQGLFDDFHGGWKPIDEEHRSMSYEEYEGKRPGASKYMPDWPESERTHYQMYENTTEGTPISSVHVTLEEVARDLADNKASWFADATASYEEWLSFLKGERHDAGYLILQAPTERR